MDVKLNFSQITDFQALYKALDTIKEEVGKGQNFIANEKSNYIMRDFTRKYPEDFLSPNEKIVINKLELIKQNKKLSFEGLFYMIEGLKRISLGVESISKRGEDVFNFIPSINLANFSLYVFLGSFDLIPKEDFSFRHASESISNYLNVENISYENLTIGDLNTKEIISSYFLDGEKKREIRLYNKSVFYNTIFDKINILNAFTSALINLITDKFDYKTIKEGLNLILEKLSYSRARASLAEAMGYKNAVLSRISNKKISSIEEFLDNLI
ncbi:MAG: hypothetical protein QXV66_01405 [Candidatus Rehaiarchaeum fermentans]|nr:hypothetical protein [Candidatus Rehaiarchaeum fermentans]